MIINCVGYIQGEKYKTLTLSEIQNFLLKPDGLVWLALFEPTDEELKSASELFHLHPLAVEDAHHGGQRPKVEEYQDSLFVVVPGFEFRDGELCQGEVYLFAGKNYVVSIRKNYSFGFSEVRERCEREPHLLSLGSGFVAYAIIDSVVDRYFPIVEKLEDELEVLESRIFSQEEPRLNIEALYLLKHKMIQIKHATGALLDSMGKLYGGRVPPMCIGTQEYFRDIVDHLHRMSAAVDNAREMLTTAIQVNLTVISLGDSKINKRLASWAALLAIPTMIAGIYGMNFRLMPELEWEYGYPISLFLMVVIDFYLFYRFKKSGWL